MTVPSVDSTVVFVPLPPVARSEKSITAFVSFTAVPFPSFYTNVTFFVDASYL